MRAGDFDELLFFRSISDAGVRALLIGRRALVVLGLPMLTADYDFWIAIDDIAAFNGAAARCELTPAEPPEAARRRGRYVLENDEHVDVLVAKAVTTVDGVRVSFEAVWERRTEIVLEAGVTIHVPSIDDLILTKRFANRPKDLEDIRLLQILKSDAES